MDRFPRMLTMLVCLTMLLAPWVAGVTAAPEEPPTAGPPFAQSVPGPVQQLAREDAAQGALDPLAAELTALFDHEGHLDVAGLLDLVRREASDVSGVDLTQLPDRYHVPMSGPVGTETYAAHHIGGIIRIPVPAGDLDGDGGDDTLVYEFDYSTFDADLVALDGDDGTVLWTYAPAAGTDTIPVPMGDLDGDGADDLVVLTLIVDGEDVGNCAVLACAWQEVADLEWHLAGIDGRDGSTLWERTEPGAYTSTVALGAVPFASSTYLYSIHVDNLFVLPAPMGDVDGDGGVDLLWSAHDVDLAVLYEGAGFLAGAGGVVEVASWDLEATTLSGADGSAGASFRVEDATDLPLAFPVADLDGDGAQDVVVAAPHGLPATSACAYAVFYGVCMDPTGSGSGLALDAFSSADGAALWSAQHDDAEIVARFPYTTADFTGDGADDLLVVALDRLDVMRLQVFDGATGAFVWSMEEGEEYLLDVVPTGDVDGDGGADLLYTAYDFGTEAWAVGVISGTGTSEAWTTTTPVDLSYAYWIWFDLADLDGDGLDDLVLSAWGRVDDNGTGIDVRAVSGADGTLLWSDLITENGARVAFGDLDGDGADDLLDFKFANAGSGVWTFGFTALDGLALDVLWATDRAIEDPTFVAGTSLGDLDGDGAEDLGLVLGDLVNGTIGTGVEALRGVDASVLWTYGDLPPEATVPEPVDLPGDAGTDTDAGDSPATALYLEPGSYNGTLDPAADDHEDWYAVNLTAGDVLEVVMDPDIADFDLELYDTNGDFVDGSWFGGEAAESATLTAEVDGTYYILVEVWSGSGLYTLDVALEAAPEPPAPPEVEPRLETFAFDGRIGCSLTPGPVATRDYCADAGFESQEVFEMPFAPGVTGLHVEVAWDDSDRLAASTMMARFLAPPGLESAEGGTVLVHDLDVDPSAAWNYENHTAHLTVRPTESPLGVVQDQAFEVCVTVQYGGESLPAGHSCFA